MAKSAAWPSIGTIVGDASTVEFTFILRSFKSRVGDIVAIPMHVPSRDYQSKDDIIAWGRITAIQRYNPFFPYEAAQELAAESIPLVDTVLSNSRDQLQAAVLVLGFTSGDTGADLDLYPLTYPIPPAADVRYPPAEAIKSLLSGGLKGQTPLHIGTLIARDDVKVEISAERIAARHLAILAMTGGGKTVAARRILREFIDLRYPVLIFDPHGDYIGLWERRSLFPNSNIKLFYPHIVMTDQNRQIVEILISKMTLGLTEPQRDLLGGLLADTDPQAGQPIIDYIETLISKLNARAEGPSGKGKIPTIMAVRRSLKIVDGQLRKMEISNNKLRKVLHHLEFTELPDPEGRPEGIVSPGQVSVLYLGGYDHLTQCTIVSILMESLFNHRAELADRIPPFLTVIEEAHTFIPSSREGTDETPSLSTLRKVITEGRKFGVGLMLVTQRPSRVDETILSQCNSFLILRLVNPKDQSYVRSVMENLPDSDARMLPAFGPGQGIISGQAVRFPLLVKIKFDADLIGSRTGDENFIAQAKDWKPSPKAARSEQAAAVAQRIASRGKRRKFKNKRNNA